MEYLYKSEYLHDLSCHKEFNRSYLDANPFHLILRSIGCYTLLMLISLFDSPIAIQYYFIFAIVFVVTLFITRSKKGDIQYKRMLQANNGQCTYQQQFFTETGVQCVNLRNGNKGYYAYDQFRYAVESKNLLILVMQHRTCLIINKANLEGGSVPELFAFLKTHCPKLKGKKPRKTIVGQIVRFLIVAITILGAVWALLNLPGYSLMDKLTGRLDNAMSYEQMAEALTDVDIHISDLTIQDMLAFDQEHLAAAGEDYYKNSLRNQKIEDLLCWEGIGVYDMDTGKWYPSESGIYCQEMEVWNAGSIYSDFLTGISAMHDDLVFTDVHEDMSNTEIDTGYGTVTIAFTFQGEAHTITANYFYDWFDTYAITQLAKIVKTDAQQLYVYYVEDYSALLYYGTPKQVRSLERLTGMNFKRATFLTW